MRNRRGKKNKGNVDGAAAEQRSKVKQEEKVRCAREESEEVAYLE
jgi:hypothetical protein